jgi:hypothetical protein
MAAELEGPAHERELIPSDPGPGPGRVWREPMQDSCIELEDFPVDRHRVLDTHDELHMQRPFDLAGLPHRHRLKDHR